MDRLLMILIMIQDIPQDLDIPRVLLQAFLVSSYFQIWFDGKNFLLGQLVYILKVFLLLYLQEVDLKAAKMTIRNTKMVIHPFY